MENSSPLAPEILVPRIGEYLVDRGLISKSDLDEALENQKEDNLGIRPLLGQVLVKLGKISRPDLDQAITEQILQLRRALEDANHHLEQRVQIRTAQLENALQRLSLLSQEKANFVSNVSHELRTPLTHLIGYLDLFSNQDLGSLTEEQQNALVVMLRATNRLEQLINDLILFSDSERSSLVLQQSTFSINACCLKAIKAARNAAKEKEISLEFQSSADNLLVHADEGKIYWVISHLIDNALKFTPNMGKITVQIEQTGKVVAINISDTGIGIAEDKIAEIFEPFHQLDGSTTRRYGGTGLGLSLAKKIIEAHGTTIHVVSIPDQGSRFEFVLKSA